MPIPSRWSRRLVVLALLGLCTAAAGAAERASSVRIDYDGLIDRSAVTHSGRTVGAVLDPPRGGRLRRADLAELQPYLAPLSFACGEVAEAARPSAGGPLANVADDYPPGSAQPAWAALFREGRYQLFVGGGRARLFLEGRPGEPPAALYRRRFGVVRHALRRALGKDGTGRLVLEVYAFSNDYGARTLRLDLAPWVTTVAPRDCQPRLRGIPLEGLADFFARGPALEAVEIDDDANLFLYGSGAAGRTVAGRTASLEDFAVVYRAVFHHGRNPPYVSLDPDTDSRYAQVNFGGLLADTRVGSVLLEADRLFKTIVSGFDPDSRRSVAETIRRSVPGFRAADERALFRGGSGDVRARFWFYPDRIRTVTDGRIGVVASDRFTADLERTDGVPVPFRVGREAVDDLNGNYDAYARALSPLRELRTVGRMMAIAKWLQAAKAADRVDLDALLSVELSPFRTPARTRKLLAATRGLRGAGDNAAVREERYCLDDILDGGSANTPDGTFLDQARMRVAHVGAQARAAAGVAPVPPPRSSWYIVASLSGGIEMNPAKLAPPRQAPRSPLIEKIRAARAAAPGGPGGIYRSTLRGLPPRSPAPAAVSPTPAAQPHALPAPPGAPAAGPAVAPRDRGSEFSWKTLAYPEGIVASGDPRPGGTIVLRRRNAPGR